MKNLSRKEAITILEGMRIDIPVPKAAVTQIKRNLALDMAINALNCSEIPNNSDAISRQAALEAIRTMQTYKLFAGDDMLLIDQAEAQTELMMLPSAQPERKTGRWIPTYEDCCADVWVKWKCSECGYVRKKGWKQTYDGAKPDALFCEMCNADMRGEKK